MVRRKVSWLSIISLAVSVISIFAFALLLEAENAYLWIVRIIWIVSGYLSAVSPIVSKWYRIKYRYGGKMLEIMSLAVGFFAFSFVLLYSTSINSSLCSYIPLAFVVLYFALFKNIEVAPAADDCDNVDMIYGENHAKHQEDTKKCSLCKKCKKEIDGMASYCPHCGKRISRTGNKKSKMVVCIISSVCLLVLICGGVYCYFNNAYEKGIEALKNSEFAVAKKYLDCIPSSDKQFREVYEYAEAGALMESGEYLQSLKAFKEQKYNPPKQLLKTLKSMAYKQAIQYYRASKFDAAKEGFILLNDYEDSQSYVLLIDAQSMNTDEAFDILMELFYFANTRHIIKSNSFYLRKFLDGSWFSNKIQVEFDGSNFKCEEYFGEKNMEYKIEEGIIYIDSQKYFEISLVQEDIIDLKCLVDGNEYGLFRK